MVHRFNDHVPFANQDEVSFANQVDLVDEFRQTISDLATGSEPRTVTHALLQERGEPVTAADITAITGQTPEYVERTLFFMELGGWTIQLTENGFSKYLITSPLED